jgi:hypothetical protein
VESLLRRAFARFRLRGALARRDGLAESERVVGVGAFLAAIVRVRDRWPATTMTNAEATLTENAATVAEQGAHVAPEKASSKKGATQKKGAPKGQKSAKSSKAKASPKKGAKAAKKSSKPAPAKDASLPRAESKGGKILELIWRPKGATLAEIQKATDWQAHSVRGFLSTAAKKHGLKIESTKTEAGDRVYQIKK